MPPDREQERHRLGVSASELAQMGVCESLVVFEHTLGRRRTSAQRQAIRRGVSAHRRFYRDGHIDSARIGRCFIASLVFGSSAPQTLALRRLRDQFLRRWRVGRWLILRYYSAAPAFCVWLRGRPVAVGLIRALLQPFAWCAACWLHGAGREDGT